MNNVNVVELRPAEEQPGGEVLFALDVNRYRITLCASGDHFYVIDTRPDLGHDHPHHP